MKIEGQTFIVTGGASGLGEATVRSLHQRGANVVVADLNSEAGNTLCKDLGNRAIYCNTDVTSESDAQGCIDSAVEKFGAIHGLINCAGIGVAKKVLGREGPHDLEGFSKTIQINLIGTFNMSRLAAQNMVGNSPMADNERGIIINTASVAAYEGQIGQAAYSASKGGIVALTLPMARELARDGVRVMCIAPGLFLTPLLAALPEEAQKSLAASIPYPPRLGDPAEFGDLVCTIVNNVMLNGETIRLDGALRMAPR